VSIYFSINNYKDKKNKSFYPEKAKVEIPKEKDLGK
jgi:hypothetical protein